MTVRQVNDYLYIVDTSTELSTGWAEGVYAYVNDIKTEYIYKNSTFTLIASGVEPYAISFGLGDGFLSSTYSVLDYLGGYTSSFVASSMSEDLTYILPSGYGSAGYVLTDTGSGVLAWLQSGSGTVSGYVPYTGATSDLDLGSYGILLSSFTMATGATSGYVLTCDGSGVAYWVSGGGGITYTFIPPLNEDGGEVTIDLSDYATTSSLSSYVLTDTLSAYALTETLSSYALTESLSAYALTESLSSYATTASLSSYALTETLSSYALTESLSSYATTASLSAYETLVSTGESNKFYNGTKTWLVVPASAVSVAPTGDISSTNVQDALAEIDTEKASTTSLSAYALTETLTSYSTTGHTHTAYIPYTGAVSAVDLGSQNLTTEGAVVVGAHTSSGTTEQVVNIMYGTGSPPAGTYKEGTLYFRYIV